MKMTYSQAPTPLPDLDVPGEQASRRLAALEKASQKRRDLQAAGEVERLDPIEKARRNPTSLRMAINAKCFDCMGGNADPGVRRRIGDCEISACSHHPVRPYQQRKEQSDE